MKKYELQHFHNGKWWGLGERTEEQIQSIIAACTWYSKKDYGYIINLPKLFETEPDFRAVEVK